MSETPTIDLDQVSSAHATPGWPLVHRLRLADRPGRTLLAAAMAALLLLILPGSPPPPRLTLVLTVAAETLQLAQDRLYSIDPAAPDGSVVTAHDLATGEVAWRTPTPHGSGLITSVVDSGVLITSWLPPTHPDAPAVTTSLHPETGEVRWTAPGTPAGSGASALVLRVPEPGGSDDLDSPRFEHVVVAPESGDLRWRFESDSGFTIDDDADLLLRVVGEELISHRLTTGEVTAGAPLPTGRSVGLVSTSTSPMLVLAEGPDGRSLHAYDAQLNPVWRTQLNSDARSPHLVTPCGDLICFVVGDTVGALDPQDGAVRWVVAELPLDGFSQYPAVVGNPPHEALTFMSRGEDGRSQTILSLASGVVVHEWSDWWITPDASHETGDRPAMAVGAEARTGEIWAGLYDVEHGHFHPWAPMKSAESRPHCVGAWPDLYCWADAGTALQQLTVWRMAR